MLIAQYWASVRAAYPWIPEVRPVPNAIGAPAYYLGIQDGAAVFSYELGAVLGKDGGVVWHEAGHCAIDVASRISGTSSNDIMTAYWTARGFPGTWQQQQAKADAARAAGVGGFALHQMLPNEMFADTFAATNVAGYPDGDQFNVPIDRAKMRTFFAGLPWLMSAPVNAAPMGAMHGQFVFALRTGMAYGAAGPSGLGAGELWAVALANGIPRRIASYVTTLGPTLPDTNVFSRELSPDGKRLVLSVGVLLGGGWHDVIAVVELETGTVTQLTNDAAYHDLYPAWSPDGRKIAFARRFNQGTTFDSGLWLMNADGTGVTQLLETAPAGATVVYGWTADGSGIAYDAIDRGGSYAVYDVARGTTTRFDGYVSLPSPGAWRAAKPSFVGAFSAAGDLATSLAVADGVGAPLRTIAPRQPGFVLSAPRWNPASADVLYLRTLNDYTELYRVSATDGKDPGRIVTSAPPLVASWSPSGADVFFVATTVTPPLVSLRSVHADGSGEKEIATVDQSLPQFRETVRDLVALAFP